MGFVHLHLHTDYSMLDGVGRSVEYADLASRFGHPAIAVTDHGNLYGLPQHFRSCREYGVKPIAGCEFYANDNRDRDKDTIKGKARQEAIAKGTLDPTFTDAHIVALAQTPEGWKNLLRINHDSVINGYYYQPRTTHDKILEHSDGLIVTTACIGSLFGSYARMGKERELRNLMGKFRDRMGDRFLCELHFNELDEQKRVNDLLIRVARDLRVPLTVALDVHYACQQDCDRQQEMIGVSRRKLVSDPDSFKINAKHLFYADESDVGAIAHKLGYRVDKRVLAAACDKTVEVAVSCSADIYGAGDLLPPRYIDGSGSPVDDPMRVIRARCIEGFRELFGRVPADRLRVYVDRLRHELAVVESCRMADFYLVTADVTDFCRREGILYWVRGSGCASLVARCLGITSVDPVRFGLLFERFVDPSRPNAPDFDMDIDNTRREEVIDWFVKKYGGANGERVARICAIATFGLKSAIRDFCWVNEVPKHLIDGLSKSVDKIERSNKTLEDRLGSCTVPDRPAVVSEALAAIRSGLDEKFHEDLSRHASKVRHALEMVGRVRGRGLHAAGYVVGPAPLVDFLPIDLALHPKTKQPIIITAWGEGQATQDIGPTGLMKLDFLGLETLAVLGKILRDVLARRGINAKEELDSFLFNFSDPAALSQISSGDGFGLHQFGAGDQSLARLASTMVLRSVMDVIALVALYRPGSMDFAEDFRLRASGRVPVPVVHPRFDAIVRETYGVLVYQEQIMRVLHELGGIPLRESYDVIKAISKKKLDKIQKPKAKFLEESVRRGLTAKQAEDIFAIVEKFAEYGFNKAHACSYGVLAFQTAWLRARFPQEFYCSWLNSTDNETEPGGGVRKVQQFMRRAEAAGVGLLPPAIGYSGSRWQYLKDGRLLAPLSLVMGIGERAADLSAEAFRSERWATVYDFLRWAEKNRNVFNSKALLAAALAGAFSRWVTRCEAVALVEAFNDLRPSKSRSRADVLEEAVALNPKSVFKYIEDDATEMAFEIRALGFAHWVNPWKIKGRDRKLRVLSKSGYIAGSESKADRAVQHAPRAFFVNARKDRTDKRGHRMAFLELSTSSGRPVRGVVFSSAMDGIEDLQPGDIYLVRGTFESTAPDAAFRVSSARDGFRRRGRSTPVSGAPVVERIDDVETVS